MLTIIKMYYSENNKLIMTRSKPRLEQTRSTIYFCSVPFWQKQDI